MNPVERARWWWEFVGDNHPWAERAWKTALLMLGRRVWYYPRRVRLQMREERTQRLRRSLRPGELLRCGTCCVVWRNDGQTWRCPSCGNMAWNERGEPLG